MLLGTLAHPIMSFDAQCPPVFVKGSCTFRDCPTIHGLFLGLTNCANTMQTLTGPLRLKDRHKTKINLQSRQKRSNYTSQLKISHFVPQRSTGLWRFYCILTSVWSQRHANSNRNSSGVVCKGPDSVSRSCEHNGLISASIKTRLQDDKATWT